MKKYLAYIIVFSGLILLEGCSSYDIIRKGEGIYQLSADITVHKNMDYMISLPENYSQKKKWPLLIFLHGSGERGDKVEDVMFHGPFKERMKGMDTPFIIVAPQCKYGETWTERNYAEVVILLIDMLKKDLRIDDQQIYITGLSLGGFGTWYLATRYKDVFAAAVPICGGGRTEWCRNLLNVPVWAFHGADDKVVPVENSERMVEAVNNFGGNAKLTIYPGAGHDSWSKTYSNPDVYKWMLEQKKSGEKFVVPAKVKSSSGNGNYCFDNNYITGWRSENNGWLEIELFSEKASRLTVHFKDLFSGEIVIENLKEKMNSGYRKEFREVAKAEIKLEEKPVRFRISFNTDNAKSFTIWEITIK